MGCKEKLEAYLREQGVPFEVQRHPPASTAQRVAASEHLPGRLLAKAVLVVADGRLALLAVPASHRVELEQARAALGAQELRLATEEEIAAALPDCELGAVPPFGNLYGLAVWVDRSLAEDEAIFFPAGTRVETLSLAYADFARLVQPRVATFAAHL